jgi:acyl-CoA thioesterase I
MSNPAARMWLQYTHLDKLYGYLPGMTDALPSLFGLERAEYAELTAGFDAQAQQAAQQLLDEDSFAAQVDALPFRPGPTVLAVGDSMTDDLQSWAEILRHLLDLRRGHGTRVVNGGLSAHTTAMVLRRWPATLRATEPDWIVCALGGNDVTRVGPEPNNQ